MNFKKDNNLLNGKGENDIDWITVKGTHIPIKKGESVREAIKEKFNNKNTNMENPETNKYYVETIDRKNKKVLKSKVTEIMNRIVKEKVEHSVVIDKDGNIFEKVGGEDYVEDMGLDLTDAIDIHNHLNDVSFGEEDFNFIKKHIGIEFLNVTPKYIHRMKVIKKVDKPYGYFYRIGMQQEETDWLNQQHYIMESVKREGYIEYDRIIRYSGM